jgi:hypothetical protein
MLNEDERGRAARQCELDTLLLDLERRRKRHVLKVQSFNPHAG